MKNFDKDLGEGDLFDDQPAEEPAEFSPALRRQVYAQPLIRAFLKFIHENNLREAAAKKLGEAIRQRKVNRMRKLRSKQTEPGSATHEQKKIDLRKKMSRLRTTREF